MSFAFASPLFLLFPLLAFVAYRWTYRKSEPLPHPDLGTLQRIPRGVRAVLRSPLLAIAVATFITLLALAGARPQSAQAVSERHRGRNLVLALDISKSMAAVDFDSDLGVLSRMNAVKSVVSDFLAHRAGDRIGIVVFGSQAMVQSPLTLDHTLLKQLVSKLDVGLAGDGTAIGDGLGLALKRVEGVDQSARAIILMTDGVSNAGEVNPLKAAKVARDLGIKVHTIGIGSSGSSSLQLPGGMMLRGYGPQSEFDEKTLKEIAELTGGVYFHARDLAGLKSIYDEIDKLERTEDDDGSAQKIEEHFPIYAWYALAAYLTYLLLARGVLSKVP